MTSFPSFPVRLLPICALLLGVLAAPAQAEKADRLKKMEVESDQPGKVDLAIGLLLLSWLGVGAVLLAVPGVFAVLRWACFAYLMWLAVVIFMEGQAKADAARSPSAAPLAAPAASRPMRWHEACVFQLINPKAWMMSITLASAFYGNNSPDAADITVAALSWVAVGTPSMFVWVVWGASIDRVLKRPLERRVYAWVMSLAVAATAVWMLR